METETSSLSKTCNNLVWARVKPGTQCSLQVSPVGGSCPLLSARVSNGQKLEPEADLGLETGMLGGSLQHCTKHLLMVPLYRQAGEVLVTEKRRQSQHSTPGAAPSVHLPRCLPSCVQISAHTRRCCSRSPGTSDNLLGAQPHWETPDAQALLEEEWEEPFFLLCIQDQVNRSTQDDTSG